MGSLHLYLKVEYRALDRLCCAIEFFVKSLINKLSSGCNF